MIPAPTGGQKLITVLYIPVAGEPDLREIDSTDLGAWRSLLDGGWLESIAGPDWIMFCDEDGARKSLSINMEANQLLAMLRWEAIEHNPPIVGPVIVSGTVDQHGDSTSLPQRIRGLYE